MIARRDAVRAALAALFAADVTGIADAARANGEDNTLASALNAPRADVPVSRGVVDMRDVLRETSIANIGQLAPGSRAAVDVAIALGVVDFGHPDMVAACTALGVATTRPGSFAESQALGTVTALDVADALRVPTMRYVADDGATITHEIEG